MKTYTIHGVEFPVDSTDGLPDLFSVAALLNTFKGMARAHHGYGCADVEQGSFVFDSGWGAPEDAQAFAAKVQALDPYVSDITVTTTGRTAFGGRRVEVRFKTHVKFCSDNVFGR